MRTIRTSENRARFLEALRESAGNATQAAAAVDLGRTALYQWKEQDPAFSDEWERAMLISTEGLEDECRRRAMAGSDLLMIFMLKALKPEKFRERQTIDVNQTFSVNIRRMPIEELRAELAELMDQANDSGKVITLTPKERE